MLTLDPNDYVSVCGFAAKFLTSTNKTEKNNITTNFYYNSLTKMALVGKSPEGNVERPPLDT